MGGCDRNLMGMFTECLLCAEGCGGADWDLVSIWWGPHSLGRANTIFSSSNNNNTSSYCLSSI